MGTVGSPPEARLPVNHTPLCFSRNSLRKSNSEDSSVGQYLFSWFLGWVKINYFLLILYRTHKYVKIQKPQRSLYLEINNIKILMYNFPTFLLYLYGQKKNSWNYILHIIVQLFSMECVLIIFPHGWVLLTVNFSHLDEHLPYWMCHNFSNQLLLCWTFSFQYFSLPERKMLP